jgi:hypothetical protein
VTLSWHRLNAQSFPLIARLNFLNKALPLGHDTRHGDQYFWLKQTSFYFSS